MKPYIELNTAHRMTAKNEFEKNFYKLLNNAVFGKTMENVRNRRDIKLCQKWKGCAGAEKLKANPFFMTSKIFCENCAAIELSQSECMLNKPISIGMAVL